MSTRIRRQTRKNDTTADLRSLDDVFQQKHGLQKQPAGEDTEPKTLRDRVETARKAAATTKRVAVTAATMHKTPLLYRNRRALRPWYAAAGTAALGSTGALVAGLVDGPGLLGMDLADLAISGGTGATALAGGMIAYKLAQKKVGEQLERSGMAGRLKTGLGAACAWCATAPLTGVTAAEMWLALGLGTVSLSARWWQRIRPAYPVGPAPTPAAKQTETSARPVVDFKKRPTSEIIAGWEADVAATDGGALPGSTIEYKGALTNGRAFTVQLKAGKQTLAMARGAVDKIAGAIKVAEPRIAFELPDIDDPAVIELRVIDNSPVMSGVAYEGPQIVQDERGTHIVLGPYADGEGDALFTVLVEDALLGGYIFGGTNAGKSRVVELIAIGLRKMGIEIWYLDPQEGQSSPALMELADWPLAGLGDDDDPTCNIDALVGAMKGGVRYRSKRLAVNRQKGFTHTRALPGVMVIIDESADVFNEVSPSGLTYGEIFGLLAKKIRKNGIGLLAVGHIYTLGAFGDSKLLRSSLAGFNLIALRTTEKSDSTLLPSGMPDPTVLPELPGFGYIKSKAALRLAAFRAAYVQNPAEWLASLTPWELDNGTANAAGDVYVRRFEIAQEKRRELELELAAMESGDFSFDEEDDSKDTPGAEPAPGAPLVELPALGGGVITLPAKPLTPGAERVMIMLRKGGDWHVNDLAEGLAISPQVVRRHIKAIGETRLTKVRDAVYRVK
ncbi:hypothetical protein BS329_15540 [Amycolatopsis coloradensis]|uniref:FtsK domain-containing protein n=1 Tax=Amycolatopsis coloradensis TaxID=76021 RepID=A0A1R0KUI3_9PSEU|nr:hypothetical protein [Amycolatopsis coloradensis]OLZ51676.1 hypothetical protein BS329_15540 [Amycolatopsis coloradensis]